MKELIIYIALIIIMPISLLIIFLEKRARRVMLSFLSGVIVCFMAYYINTLVYQNLSLSSGDYSLVLGPMIEEILKFIPLIIYCYTLKKGKRQTIAMSFALGVGFCLVENLFYLIKNIEVASIAWIVTRCVGAGLMHSMSATFIGYGLYKARESNNKKVIIIIVTLLIAMAYHSIFNVLISIDYVKYVGFFIPIISYIVLSLIIKKDAIKAFFDDDIINEKKEEEK